MTAFVSFEWFKLRKRRMPWIILALILALTILAFWGQATRGDGRPNLFLPRGWLAALSFCSFFAPFFWPVLAGSWAGNEYGWGTIRAVLTRRPNRITHVLAALAVLLVALVLALLAILVVASVAGIVVSLATGNGVFTSGIMSGDFLLVLLKGLLTAWYVSAFFLLIAYVAAVMFRSAAVGIGFGIGSSLAQLVLQHILRDLGATWQTIADHFPVVYANNMITQVVWSKLMPGTSLANVDPGTPSAGQSLLALAIYSVIALALMLGAVRARDITA
jgi:ABC-type transport system involved in multi-copper enzyme maturation permease subunit